MGCTSSVERLIPKLPGKINEGDVCTSAEQTNSPDTLKSQASGDNDDEFPSDPLRSVVFSIPPDSEPIEISKGITYRGEWVNGRQHGVGETKYADGSIYLGYFKEGKPDGLGIFTTKDGSQYQGSFQEGKAHGYGTYRDKDGSRYFGPYVADRREGRGKEIQADGLKYTGEYVKGQKHGQGKLVAPNGEMYVGEFCNGEIHGTGTYTWPDGRIYTGQWEKNCQNGHAEFRWPDGRVYKGQYKNGRLQGYGVLEWKDGRKYDGQWKNGLQNGVGKYWGSSHWYREAQFLDGIRVKWLSDIVYVDDKEQESQSPQNKDENRESCVDKGLSTNLKESRGSVSSTNGKLCINDAQNSLESNAQVEEENLPLKGTVAQRIAQFGSKASN